MSVDMSDPDYSGKYTVTPDGDVIRNDDYDEPAEQEPAEQEPAEQEPAEQEPAEQGPAEQGPAEDYGDPFAETE